MGKKLINPTAHGVIDYLWSGAMIAAPWIFGFSRNKRATAYCVAAGAGTVAVSLATRYPLGAAKIIPFPVHGAVDAVAGVSTAAAPWAMGFSEDRAATLTHVVAGLGALLVVSLTDYGAADGREGQGLAEALSDEIADSRPELLESPAERETVDA